MSDFEITLFSIINVFVTVISIFLFAILTILSYKRKEFDLNPELILPTNSEVIKKTKMSLSFGLLILTIRTAPLDGFTLLDSTPPQPGQAALMARYIIHNSDWVSIATITTLDQIKSYPFISIESMSDGPITKGTGVPYLYLTDKDLLVIDLKQDNRCSLIASLAQSDYCRDNSYDPEDPRCARVTLTGHLVNVDNTTSEYTFAKEALFSRHPVMKRWPASHNFAFAKLDIELVALFDFFGGMKYVTVEDYFNANGRHSDFQYLQFEDVKVMDADF